jgi:hypothetical protein
MNYMTGMRKSSTTVNATWDPDITELFREVQNGECLSFINGTTENVPCDSSFGFLCEEMLVWLWFFYLIINLSFVIF